MIKSLPIANFMSGDVHCLRLVSYPSSAIFGRVLSITLERRSSRGSEPVPNATLINEAQNVKFPVQSGLTYLFHIINMGGFAAQFVEFKDHDMTVVEIDGVYTKPYTIPRLFIAAAQRYSVLIKAKVNPQKNFAIVVSMDENMFDPGVIPPGLKDNVSGRSITSLCFMFI